MQLIIISGTSGSGKSVALSVLEDIGFYCVDNLPISLLPQLTDILIKTEKKVVISIDIRNLTTILELEQAIAKLSKQIEVINIFLDADIQTLLKRYSDSRRSHPLSTNTMSLEQAIVLEKEKLAPIIVRADHFIDTTNFSNHQLADYLIHLFSTDKDKELIISFESFGFKYGVPLNADFIFDVRFLPNPYWEQPLRQYTGEQQPVIDFFQQHVLVDTFIQKTINYLKEWLPMLKNNNRSYLTIAIGCTGGKHRSVYVTNQIANYFKQHEKNINVYHRALNK